MKNKKIVSAIALTLMVGGSMGSLGGIENNNIDRVYAKQTSGFKDVPSDSFANEAILSLTGKNIIIGYPNNLYKPSETVTRGQFASMLARALNLPKADSSFKDLTKKMALYDSLSRAAKAGIIKGDSKGYVKSDQNVSRADIAVMIDRAMQLKGNYNKTTDLAFTDKNSIPAYAMDSVKKMTKYGIIQGKGNNSFAPSEYADRTTSAVFIYRMLNVLDEKPDNGGGGTTQPPVVTPEPPVVTPEPPTNGGGGGTTTPPVVTPNPEKDYHDMTLAEIKAIVGEIMVVDRILLGGKEQIRTLDYVADYHRRLNDPIWSEYMVSPEEWFKDWVENQRGGFTSMLSAGYPKDREIISFNGKAYKDSDLYSPQVANSIPNIDKVLPSQPKEEGKFLIDVMSFSPNFVTYTKKQVKTNNLDTSPVESGNDYIVNLEKVFENAPGVTVAKDGSEITYNGKKVVLTNRQKKMTVNGTEKTLSSAAVLTNGSYYAPVREIAEALGLDTRKVVSGVMFNYRLEIANYHLEKEEGIWE